MLFCHRIISGTSFACPYVSGVLARLLSSNGTSKATSNATSVTDALLRLASPGLLTDPVVNSTRVLHKSQGSESGGGAGTPV